MWKILFGHVKFEMIFKHVSGSIDQAVGNEFSGEFWTLVQDAEDLAFYPSSTTQLPKTSQ